MRIPLSLMLATTFVCSATASENITRQLEFVDLLQASSSSVFNNRTGTSVLGTSTQDGHKTASLLFNTYRASFGQARSSAMDWSPYNIVTFKFTNHESRRVNMRFIVLLTSNPDNYTGALTANFFVGPNETRRFAINLNLDDPDPYGLSCLEPVFLTPYERVVSGTSYRNVKTIYHWRFSSQESEPVRADLADLRLVRQSLDFTGIVDDFGQYTKQNWPGKVISEADLLARKSAEQAELAANPGPGETLGTTQIVNESPQLGQWAIVSTSSGMKYIQHPNGRLFWSFGIAGILPGMPTPVQGREHYFQTLQSTSGRFADAYSYQKTSDGTTKLSYDFGKQNLMAKYGDTGYLSAWTSTVKKRLASWGVNTLGIQSAKELVDNSIPFTHIIYTRNFPTRLRVPKQLWGSLPDPFDSNFDSWTINSFKTELAPYVAMTNFMGVFVDNEMSFGEMRSDADHYNIPLGVITAPSSQPIKVWWVDQLTNKYGTIDSLNSAWGSSFSSFSALLSNTTWKPSTYTSGMETDFRNLIKSYGTKYYSQVRSALDAAGFKGLYLGSRYDDYNPEIIAGAAPYVDAHSFNIYRTVDNFDWSYINGLSKPVLISEFTYAVLGAGTFGGQSEVISHDERVAEAKAYMEKALSLSNVIGLQWYRYQDQPLTGRYTDYENGGNGVVDVADTPYAGTVRWFREFTSDMYTVRGGLTGSGDTGEGDLGGGDSGTGDTGGGGTGGGEEEIVPPADTVAPTVRITSVADGDKVRGTVTINHNYSDNVGVVKAKIYIDGVYKHTRVTAPFTFTWSTTGVSRGKHTIEVRVFDAAGNIGSHKITVTK